MTLVSLQLGAAASDFVGVSGAPSRGEMVAADASKGTKPEEILILRTLIV